MSSNSNRSIDINQVLVRIAELVGVDSDAQLAAELGTTSQVVHGWRKRGTVPFEKLVDFATRPDIGTSVDFLLFGSEPSESQLEPYLLDDFGALVRLGFKPRGYADISCGLPEIHRFLYGLIEIEKARDHPSNRRVSALEKLASEYRADGVVDSVGLPTAYELLLRVPIARHSVRLSPEIPDFDATLAPSLASDKPGESKKKR